MSNAAKRSQGWTDQDDGHQCPDSGNTTQPEGDEERTGGEEGEAKSRHEPFEEFGCEGRREGGTRLGQRQMFGS